MKQIEKILKHISVLFYIFVGVFVLGTIYGFVSGIILGIESAKQAPTEMSLYMMVIVFTVSLLMVVISIWSFVLFVKLLISIGRSISRKNIFCAKTISLIERYAIVYMVTILLAFINAMIYTDQLKITESIYQNTSLISELSSVIMLLMFGQVLRIGKILREEQELTV